MFNFLFDGKIGEYLAPISASNQFFLAIQNHRNSEVESLLSSGQADLRKIESCGYAAIHCACRYNNRYTLELFLNLGIPINFPDQQGNTPLHYASKYGHLDLCKCLVEKGCSAGAKNFNGQTPYDLAESHTVRQYLLPLQFKTEREIDLANGGYGGATPYIHGGMYGSSGAPLVSNSYPTPPQQSTLSPPSSIDPSSYSVPSPPAQQQYSLYPPPPLPTSTDPSIPAPPPASPSPPLPSSTSPASGGSPRFIQPDGFHSSASDPALQAKYGHVKNLISIAPPPTGGPILNYSSNFQGSGSGGVGGGVGRVGGVGSNVGGGMGGGAGSVFNRYVAYDPHTHSPLPPPSYPPSYPSPSPSPSSLPPSSTPVMTSNFAPPPPSPHLTSSNSVPSFSPPPSSFLPPSSSPSTVTPSPFVPPSSASFGPPPSPLHLHHTPLPPPIQIQAHTSLTSSSSSTTSGSPSSSSSSSRPSPLKPPLSSIRVQLDVPSPPPSTTLPPSSSLPSSSTLPLPPAPSSSTSSSFLPPPPYSNSSSSSAPPSPFLPPPLPPTTFSHPPPSHLPPTPVTSLPPSANVTVFNPSLDTMEEINLDSSSSSIM